MTSPTTLTLTAKVGGMTGTATVLATPPPTCNSLDPSVAPVVQIMNVGAVSPVGTGGVVADGTYYLTALNLYTGVGGRRAQTGQTRQIVVQISGTTVNEALEINGAGSMQLTITETFNANGTALIR